MSVIAQKEGTMFTSLLVGLVFAAMPIKASLDVSVEFDPNRFHIGDVAFARVTLENRGEHEIPNVQTMYASLAGSASYTMSFVWYPYVFRFDCAPSAAGQGKHSEQTMAPGDKWIVDYPMLAMPEPKYFDDQFWRRVMKDEAPLIKTRLYGNVRRQISMGVDRDLYLRDRPGREVAFLSQLFRESEMERKAEGEEFDVYPFQPSELGVKIVREDMIQRLIAFEGQLTPGTLRDVVKATRLMRVLYFSEDPKTRDATVRKLLKWLGTLPTIQREAFAIQLDSYIRRPVPGGGRLDPKLHPEYADLLRGVIQFMPERAYGSATFRQDHLKYLEGIGK